MGYVITFIFGASLSCIFFTAAAAAAFGEYWWLALLLLSIFTGAIFSFLFGGR